VGNNSDPTMAGVMKNKNKKSSTVKSEGDCLMQDKIQNHRTEEQQSIPSHKTK